MTNETAQLSMELNAELANAAPAEPPKKIDPKLATWRFSTLKQFSLSAAHALAALKDESEETLALRLGAGAHAMLFGLPVEMYAAKRDDRIEAWRDFKAACAARGCETILSPAEWRQAKNVVDALRKHETAMRLLFDGTTIEETIYWTFLGVKLRSTPDAHTNERLVELKTTFTSKPERFLWQTIKYHYHAQVASYGEAIGERFGSRPAESFIIAVEKTDPFPVTVFRLTEDALEQGRKQWRLWMEELLGCLGSGYFPAYAEDIVPLDIEPNEPFEIEIDGKLVEVP